MTENRALPLSIPCAAWSHGWSRPTAISAISPPRWQPVQVQSTDLVRAGGPP